MKNYHLARILLGFGFLFLIAGFCIAAASPENVFIGIIFFGIAMFLVVLSLIPISTANTSKKDRIKNHETEFAELKHRVENLESEFAEQKDKFNQKL